MLFNYTIMINHRLLIYTSMKHSLLSLKLLAVALNSLDTLSHVRIKAFTFSFNWDSVYYEPKPSLLGASSTFVNNFWLKELHLVLLYNCNYCVYRFGILSNKLVLKPETSFYYKPFYICHYFYAILRVFVTVSHLRPSIICGLLVKLGCK